ncbi:MAG: DNA-protecting protein DprA [Defluviimonas sp.]|nr:DNA-protecting protein DprA [Defluviimonas sp.]
MAEHGSAAAALDALPDIARSAGLSGYDACPEGVALAEMKAARQVGARALFRGAPGYPRLLADIADPPPLLWCLGDPAHLLRPMIALVGARNASSLGTRMARKLAEGLGAAGFTIVSGLARGVDTAAHKAALGTGTVAVTAGGVDIVYPSENADLARDLARGGAILSEQPIGLEPQARHFPLRNRIISGLAHAVVVVEAAPRSGSLITAQSALDQGREVFAVPGHPFDGRAAGCNRLIRDGATLARGAEDVLDALDLVPDAPADAPGGAHGDAPADAHGATRNTTRAPEPAPAFPAAPGRTGTAAGAAGGTPTARPAAGKAADAPRDMGALHREILARLGPAPLAEDQLIRDLALAPAAILPELLELEIDGRILRQPGGLVSLAG